MIPIPFAKLVPKPARVLVASLLLTAASAVAGTPFSKVVTFGDSLSDTGNAFELTDGFYPVSPPNDQGRISNGPLWVEYLTEALGMKLATENQYAVVGARTDQGNFNALFGLPLANTGLRSQVALYLQHSGPGNVDPDALHTIWIGANDIFTMLYFGGDVNTVIRTAVQNTAQAVVALSSNGARHILVANLPDLGLTPFGRSFGPAGSAQLSFLSDAYNAALNQALNALNGTGIKTIRLDTADLIRDIVADPDAFGFLDATSEALGSGNDPDDYLFWDSVHPTTAGHQTVATRAIEALIAFYSPRQGREAGPGLVNSLNGLVGAAHR